MTRPPPPGQVPSPCVSVCVMDPVSGLCRGCMRTLDEISAWSLLDDDDKRSVWQSIASRRDATAPSSSGALIEGTGSDGEH